MKDFLNKLRAKPNNVKKNIALFSAGLITFSIVGIWMLAIQNDKKTEEVVKEKSASDDLKPLVLIFKNAKAGVSNITKNAKESINFKANLLDSTSSDSVEQKDTQNLDTSKDFTIIE